MILDTITKLEAVLAGAVAANQPEVHVTYQDWNDAGEQTRPAPFRVALNSTNDVTILAAPTGKSLAREIKHIAIYNKDSGSVTVTVKTDDGTTEFIWHKEAVPAGKSLNWTINTDWLLQS